MGTIRRQTFKKNTSFFSTVTSVNIPGFETAALPHKVLVLFQKTYRSPFLFLNHLSEGTFIHSYRIKLPSRKGIINRDPTTTLFLLLKK
jgi:hypothetical protein